MRNLNAVLNCFVNRQRSALQQLAQGASFQQLGHQIRCPVDGAELVSGKNVGIIESCSGLRLLLETGETVRIVRKERWQNLDRDFAFQHRVTSAVNLAHPPCSHQVENLVRIQSCACG
jgi:hypothetical protein